MIGRRVLYLVFSKQLFEIRHKEKKSKIVTRSAFADLFMCYLATADEFGLTVSVRFAPETAVSFGG